MESGIHLLSHAVSSIVSSAAQVLTIVFGMGTGVSPKRIDTGNLSFPGFQSLIVILENSTVYKTLTSSSVLVGLIQLLSQPTYNPSSLERR